MLEESLFLDRVREVGEDRLATGPTDSLAQGDVGQEAEKRVFLLRIVPN